MEFYKLILTIESCVERNLNKNNIKLFYKTILRIEQVVGWTSNIYIYIYMSEI